MISNWAWGGHFESGEASCREPLRFVVPRSELGLERSGTGTTRRAAPGASSPNGALSSYAYTRSASEQEAVNAPHTIRSARTHGRPRAFEHTRTRRLAGRSCDGGQPVHARS